MNEYRKLYRSCFNIKIMKALIPILLFAVSTFAQISGRVVGISDGDTVTILKDRSQIKIRLAGIDAPEKGQAFGQRSKENLSRLIFGKDVKVYTFKTDRYGRTVGKIMIDDLDINLQQIKDGYAWVYQAYLRELLPSDRKLYLAAESSARSEQAGLWRDTEPIAPWDYRKPPVRTFTAPKYAAVSTEALIKGNKNSMIFHEPGCRDYNKISPRNIVWFKTASEAIAAGYRKARNC